MNILVQLSHPAHFHYYHNSILQWKDDGHTVLVLIKTKDVLEQLLIESHIPYQNINSKVHRNSKVGFIWDMLIRDFRIIQYCRKNKIDILTGSSAEVAQIGWLLKKPAICTGEDDAAIIPNYVKCTAPFLQVRLTPTTCDNGVMEKKSVKYNSYQELAYLHPHHFTPNMKILEKYSIPQNQPFFILRFASLTAHHDHGIHGINAGIATELINILSPHGAIYITSERELEPEFEPYRIRIKPSDMHHVMAYATLYIGDSQTMAAEAGVLGVPFIRYNDFVGRIGYLRELEDHYILGYGIKASDPGAEEELLNLLREMLSDRELTAKHQQRRQKMLSEKIDYAQFLTWFIESYPDSARIMKENPDYQWRFR